MIKDRVESHCRPCNSALCIDVKHGPAKSHLIWRRRGVWELCTSWRS